MLENDLRLVVGVLATLGALVLAGVAASDEGNVVASGSITDLDVSDDRGRHRTFSFTVVQHVDGTVSGQGMVVRIPAGTDGGDQPTHLSFDCARVDTTFQGLPTATLGGVITQAPNPAIVGHRFWTRVVDGGSKTDWNTGVFSFAADPLPCTADPPPGLPNYFSNEAGNLTVRLPS